MKRRSLVLQGHYCQFLRIPFTCALKHTISIPPRKRLGEGEVNSEKYIGQRYKLAIREIRGGGTPKVMCGGFVHYRNVQGHVINDVTEKDLLVIFLWSKKEVLFLRLLFFSMLICYNLSCLLEYLDKI